MTAISALVLGAAAACAFLGRRRRLEARDLRAFLAEDPDGLGDEAGWRSRVARERAELEAIIRLTPPPG